MNGLIVALTTGQKVAIWVAAAVGVIGVVVAAVSAWITVVNERKRTQPIVLAHQAGKRRLNEDAGRFGAPTGRGNFVVDVYLSNEGEGAAFNVRFGVEFHGVRIPYEDEVGQHRAGSVYRVLGAGQRLPSRANAAWPLPVDALILIGKRGDPDPTRVFWARYENAQGKVWETLNPGDPSKQLGIKRVRARRFREWAEHRGRMNAVKAGADAEQAAIAELLSREQPAKG